MKKSTIWLLAVVMFTAFLALLFLQVRYMSTTMDIRTQQFDEQVNRSLYNVMRDLEQDQTLDYLEQDMIESENRYSSYQQSSTTNVTGEDRKSTRLNSSHVRISYAVFCLKKKKKQISSQDTERKDNVQHIVLASHDLLIQ